MNATRVNPKEDQPVRQAVWRARLLCLLVSLPLGVAGGEFAMRIFKRWQGQPYSVAAFRGELVEHRSRLTDPLPRPADAKTKTKKNGRREPALTQVLHPFLAYDGLASVERASQDVERYGVRDDEHLRVVVLGGSVAGLFGIEGARRLRKLLGEVPGLESKTIKFMDYGRGGHKQPQQLIRLVHLLVSGIRPDLVINLDGFNEVALGNKNRARNMYPTYPSYSHWMKLAKTLGEDEEQHAYYLKAEWAKMHLLEQIDAALESDGLWSAVLGHLAARRIARAQRMYETARDLYVEQLDRERLAPGILGPEFHGTPTEGIEMCVAMWQECSRQIQTLCDMYGIKYLHVLQPTLHDPGAKPMADREIERGRISDLWKEGVLIGYPLLRAAGEELAREGIAFYDATKVFADVEEALYYDGCHFDKRGNHLLAEAMLERLVTLLEP